MTERQPWLERVTNGMKTISSDHGNIHAGEGYSAYIVKTNLADAGTYDIQLTTPEETYVHLKFYDTWIDNAQGLFQIYEDPYSVSAGTAVTPVNRRRLGTPATSGVIVKHGVSVTLDNIDPAHTATPLETLLFGGGGTGPQGRSGGDRSLDIEWVLKPETDYVFRVTNQSGAAADIGVWLFWYEEAEG